MKLNRLKIDGLLAFYILSLGLLGLSWNYGLIDLDEKSVISSKQTLNLEYCYSKDKLEEEGLLEVLNPNHSLYYSADGGKTYTAAGNCIDPTEINNKDITNISTSIRWRPPICSGPQVKSFQYLVQDNRKGVRSNIGVFTDIKNIETSLPIVHLTINEDDLFSEVNGLLVQGAASWENSDFQEAWWYRDANYTQSGMDWEKAVYFQYFEEGHEVFGQKCGLRISGNATRGFPQKSFRIKAREQYGNDKLKYRFFGKGGKKKYESLVLRMSGNDNTETMFADMLMQKLAKDSELLTQKGKAVIMFINGNYWGIYNLRERIDKNFIARYADVKKGDVTILEDGPGLLKSGKEKDQEKFLKFIDEVNTMTVVGAEELHKIEAVIDLSSYMDYIFFETYYANNDWPDNNAMVYKVKGQKWRWILNDLDYTLAYPGENNIELNMFDKISKSGSVHAVLFNKLVTNSEFKHSFKERCKENMSRHLSEKKIEKTYNELKGAIQPEIEQQINRWRNIESVQQWEYNCQSNLNFLLNRRDVYNKHLEKL